VIWRDWKVEFGGSIAAPTSPLMMVALVGMPLPEAAKALNAKIGLMSHILML